jgi:AraC-like DNA-binding protein
MPPLDYFIHLKLQKACLLLFSTDRKVRTIAEELGYDDPYYFSRLFKKYMKSSPEIYRVTQTEQQVKEA